MSSVLQKATLRVSLTRDARRPRVVDALGKLASWAALNQAALFKHWLQLTSSSEMYRNLKRLDGTPMDD
jgi:hypothetical protein